MVNQCLILPEFLSHLVILFSQEKTHLRFYPDNYTSTTEFNATIEVCNGIRESSVVFLLERVDAREIDFMQA